MWFPTISPLSALCCRAVDTAELDSDYSWTGDMTNWLAISNNVSTVIIAFLSPPPKCDENSPSFAVSTLASSKNIRVLLQCQMPKLPLPAMPNPISMCESVGPSVMWALGKRWRSVP